LNRYRAFGLSIVSDFPLDVLPAEDCAGKPDLTIERGSIDYPLPPSGSGGAFDFIAPGGVVMIWSGMAGFRILGPDRVRVEQYPDAPDKLLVFAMLGPVMAWVLHLRGLFLLHGSSVAIDGKSVCLMGDKMAGKSTTAASFVRAGYDLVTDDLLVVDPAAPQDRMLIPGYPQLKLTESAAEQIKLVNARPLPLVTELADKRQYSLSEFHEAPLGLDYLFVLERGGEVPRVEALPFADAVAALARFNYITRFSTAPFSKAERAAHFRSCVTLAQSSVVAKLHVPHALDQLGEVVGLVERYIRGAADG
jgi:hypothetical protein